MNNSGWFNYWAVNAGGRSTGLQQLAMDTFWYIDPDYGIDGVWDNSLAADKPVYNDDFTEMTVKLRPGIYWSDGVEFTAEDVLDTINTHLNTDGLYWSAPVQINVESVEATDPDTVVFKLKKPNSRFHALFTVRWNAMWMMPKHIFEQAGDPQQFDLNPRSRSGPTRSTATIRTASGSSGPSATTGSGPRSPGSASPAPNMPPISIRAPRTSG